MEIKPGWQSTEFWGKVAVQGFLIWGTVKGNMNPEKAAMITAILEGVYNIARSAVKYNGGSLPEIPGSNVTKIEVKQ